MPSRQAPEPIIDAEERLEGFDNLMPFRGTLSVKKLDELIGYKPTHPIDIGFPKYIKWYKELDPSGKFWMDIKVSG